MDGLIFTIGAIICLLVLSGFFSGSETALTAASRARIRALIERGDKRAERVDRLREKKERLIGGILLGNNLVNILASALATSVLIKVFGDSGLAYATIGMTLLVLVFSEVMPKTYAINHAERTALAVARPLTWFIALFAPVTHAVEILVRGMFKLMGVAVGHNLSDTEEELRGAIELHEGEGGEVRQERAMLRSILDLNDVSVGEIMTHRGNMVTVDADLPPKQIVEEIVKSPYTRIPLWRKSPDNLVGVVHAKALLRIVSEAGGKVEQKDILAAANRPWFIPDTTTLQDQLEAFRVRREHFALVVDEYGEVMGLVTLEDILEEIVGEIADEHDVPVPGVKFDPDGSVVVDGTVTIRDLNREFDWKLPDDRASTLAGLIIYEARLIPEVGQVFAFHGFKFQIMQRQRNQITQLRILPLHEGQSLRLQRVG